MSQAQRRSVSTVQHRLADGDRVEPDRLLAEISETDLREGVVAGDLDPPHRPASVRRWSTRRRALLCLEIFVGVALVAVAAASSPGNVVALAVAAALGIGLESLDARDDQPPRTARSTLTDLTHAVGNRFPVVVAVQVVIAATAPVIASITPDAIPDGFRRMPTWSAVLLLLVVTDLFNYAVHRWSHEWSWWWRLHSIHHTSRRIDWLATTRGHPIDLVLIFTIATIPAIAVDAPAPMSVVIVVLFLYPFVCHANTTLRLGRLERVFVSPHFHHWHHADEPFAINRNYGSVLVVWDRMFGSAIRPEGFPRSYGVEGSDDAAPAYVAHLVQPFRRRSSSR